MRGWILGLTVACGVLAAGGAGAQERVTPLDSATPVIPQLTPLGAPPPAPYVAPKAAVQPVPVAPAKPAAAKPADHAKAAVQPSRLWTTSSVTLRAGPSANTGVVDELSPGTAVTLTGPHGEWARVRTADGIGGFIRSRYLTAQPPAVVSCEMPSGADLGPELPAGTVVAPAGSAYLRAGPGCGEHTLDVLEAGARVTVLGTSGDWYAVTGQGWERGYVHRSLVRPAAP